MVTQPESNYRLKMLKMGKEACGRNSSGTGSKDVMFITFTPACCQCDKSIAPTPASLTENLEDLEI